MRQALDQAVAVVGLGCVIPDAFGVGTFWKNTLSGHCALRPLRGGRWEWDRYHDPSGADPDKAITIVAGAVEGWSFDWRRFRVPPADVAAINPMSLMTVDAGAQALDAVKRLPAHRAGVFLGATGLGWQRDSGLRIRMGEMLEAVRASMGELPAAEREAIERDLVASLDARLGPVTEDTVVNGPASVAAGRIAMIYDLRGLHYAIDAGYASGLAALETGLRALRDGTVDLALIGGASELLSPLELVAFSRLGGLSRGALRPFDAAAEGTLLGEGVVMIALKRLDDALRDEEHIHAVVRGVGGACDGRARSLVAPSPEGQARAMQRAYRDAGVDPRTIAYVECHATGTPVGDRSELGALAQVLGRRDLVVGSGKASVGHLRGGAGALGLLRAVLAVEHRTAPRQVAFERPSEALEGTGFRVPARNTPLEAREGAPVVRAAVSAFGFGGIDYHAIVEAFDPSVHRRPRAVSGGIPRAEPIAIVGMGGMFPGAGDVPSFWRALLEGKDATREVPSERWELERHYDPDPKRADTSYTRIGCFLDRLPEADPRWKIPPASLATLDPSHLLCLRAAEEALADAGIDPEQISERDRLAVMLAFLPYQGRKFLADIRVSFGEVRAELEARLARDGMDRARIERVCADAERRFKDRLPAITEDSLTGWLGSMNAARISRLLDAHGPCFVVDAACASTHAAVHAAVTALRHRAADVALTGGVWCDMQPEFFVGACRFNALSATGSTPFDAAADGFIPGEGGGVLVLRRLDDAVRDGQRVHAVIRAVAGSSDGKGRSVLAPTVDGEASAMKLALDQGELSGGDVGYVECHGTGTALGDVVEASAVARAFGGGRPEPVRIGSVKSNIGHLNAAAGVPGLIKAALAVREGVIPASLKVARPNPAIDLEGGNIAVVRANERWERPAGGVRRAGVSSFGVGGANMHIIVEEHRMTEAKSASPPARAASIETRSPTPIAAVPAPSAALPIAKVAASDPPACLRELHALSARYAREGESALREPIGRGGWRAAVVAPSPEELDRRLALLKAALARGSELAFLRQQGVFLARPGAPVVVTFPGQGPHYANMARALAAALPDIEETLDEADDAYRVIAGRALRPSFWTDDPEGWTQLDQDIHCAVFVVNVALYRMLARRGLEPAALVGQSAGELSALAAAGALSFEDGLRAVYERTRAVLAMPTEDPGTMISIRAGVDAVRPLIEEAPGYCAIAADNGPAASIVSVGSAALEPIRERLRAAGIEHSVLAVSHGYHSQLIAGAIPQYRRALEELRFRDPAIPIYSTITGAPLAAIEPRRMPEHLARQFVEPVRLREAIERAWRAGGRVFVECGPKWSLTTFTQAILEGHEHFAQATLHPKIGEEEQAARALACLATHGHDASWPVAQRARSSSAVMARASSPPREAVASIARLAAASDRAGPSRERLVEVLRTIRDLIDTVLAEDASEPVEARLAGGAETYTLPISTSPPPRRSSKPPTLVRVPKPSDVRERPVAKAPAHDLERKLIEAFAERTGYPEEMLEPHLELEADLGIDTVKQVAVLSSVREELGLARDDSFVLREHGTIAALSAYLARRAGGATPAAGHTVADGDILKRLRAAFAERTGYPEEMLDAELELEADLGIDTVKQVAVLSSVREQLGLSVDPSFELRAHQTLAALARHFASRLGKSAAVAPQPRSEPELDARILARLVGAFAERTGYPEEMLEPDLELEADLGIDTVKQVAVLGSVREALGLSADRSFVLREHPTLRHLARYLVGRVASSERAPRPSTSEEPSASRPDVAALLVRLFAERTGYPEEMLEPDLELEADLGIDTVKQAAVLGLAREALGLPVDPSFVLREHRTLAKLAGYFRHRLGEAPPAEVPAIAPAESAPVHVAPEGAPERARLLALALEVTGIDAPLGPLRIEPAQPGSELLIEPSTAPGAPVRVISSAGVHVELGAGTEPITLSPLAPELAHALASPRHTALSAMLGSDVERAAPAGCEWVAAPRFDTLVGVVQAGAGPDVDRAGALLDAALWHAELLWTRFLGVRSRACGAARVRVAGLPESEARVVARLAPRSGGRVRADVFLYDASGTALGAIEGVEGIADAPLDAARWRLLSRRLEGIAGEDEGTPW